MDSDDNKFWQLSASSKVLAIRYQEDQSDEKLALWMSATGHVGVAGNTDPKSPLHVNGEARATKLRADEDAAVGNNLSVDKRVLLPNDGIVVIGPWGIRQSGGGDRESHLEIWRISSGAQRSSLKELLKIDWDGNVSIKGRLLESQNLSERGFTGSVNWRRIS